MLPPGLARLATKPYLTGSWETEKTMGIVVVAALAASAVAKPAAAAITATCRRTRSAASSGRRSHLLGPAVFERHVLALDIAGLFQALAKGAQALGDRLRRSGLEEADHRHRRLLRARRERPRGRRAAEQRDELAPFYLTELHLTLDEPGLRRKYIQLMRFSQEVAERFYTD